MDGLAYSPETEEPSRYVPCMYASMVSVQLPGVIFSSVAPMPKSPTHSSGRDVDPQPDTFVNSRIPPLIEPLQQALFGARTRNPVNRGADTQ